MPDKLGPTGKFPEGKLHADDEGEIKFAIGEKDGLVAIDFGKPVQWIAMKPQQAADIASLLLRRARQVARHNNETIDFTI